MKNTAYLLLIYFMIACGSSKKTTEAKKNEVATPIEEKVLEKKVILEKEVVVAIDSTNISKSTNDFNADGSNESTSNKETVVDTKYSVPFHKNLVYSSNGNVSNPSKVDKIIWTAVSYKGTPYKYGGTSKDGIDCSGLIYKAFEKRGITIPRNSAKMYEKGYSIPLNESQRGDLLFFNIPDKKTNTVVNHVGLVTSNENGEVKFLHSISSRGVVLSSILESYWSKHFIESKRVIE